MPEGCLVRSVAGRATCAILWPLLSGVEAIVLASCVCHRQPRRRSVLVLARVTAVVPPFLAVGARAVCWLALDRCLRWAQQTSVVDPVVLGGPRLGHLLSRRVAGGYRLRAGQLQLPPRPRLVAGGGPNWYIVEWPKTRRKGGGKRRRRRRRRQEGAETSERGGCLFICSASGDPVVASGCARRQCRRRLGACGRIAARACGWHPNQGCGWLLAARRSGVASKGTPRFR